jgi:hypothetical protein
MGEEGSAGINVPAGTSDEEIVRLRRLFPEAVVFEAGVRR